MLNDNNNIDWCPTKGGTFTAYEAEWESAPDKWSIIQSTTELSISGAPFPRYDGGICQSIGLMGHAQANAVAWSFAAQAEAQGKEIKVRVQPYEIVYDIKARKSITRQPLQCNLQPLQ